ncbi:MAG: hypothetical protein CK425_03930 [Parachlamydia sp.]|nr:MAG: hypothetical protein CK425_03930 [Parachlamydia sp.]
MKDLIEVSPAEQELSQQQKFSLLIDQSIERVLERFRREIPMAGMFLKGSVAEKLTHAAKEELEPLWGQMVANGLILEEKS